MIFKLIHLNQSESIKKEAGSSPDADCIEDVGEVMQTQATRQFTT
jgi:hypothetical protein